MIRHYLPVEPVAKPRMTRSDKWRKRPAVVKYHNYKDQLDNEHIGDLPPEFFAVFHVPMPQSWSEKKKKAMFGKPHQQRPDVDNFGKGLLDALCLEDSYVYDVRFRKQWSVLGGIELFIDDKYNKNIEV